VILEEQVYNIKVGKVQLFLQAYEDRGVELLKRHLGRFVGMWYRDLGGSMDEVIQHIVYDSDDERRRGRDALWQDPDWLEFAGEWGHLIEKRQTNILLAARFSPLR
jgi:hypothetical protein